MSTAPRIIDAAVFFPDGVPARVPGDAPAPDFNALVAHARSLDPKSYPMASLMSMLARENEALGAVPATLAAFADSGRPPLFVVAGQQAGLFGGPLYTLYKALHAIHLASRLTDALEYPVVPLFWVASDDHDMAEVSRLGLRSDDGSAAAIEYVPVSYTPGMPVGEVVLDEGVEDAVSVLAASLPPGDASARYIEVIRSTWCPGVRWTDAFASWMMRLLGQYGLAVFDPRWQGAKQLMLPVMRAELSRPLMSTALVNEAADAFDSARERKHAMRRPADATNLFLEIDGIREQMSWDGEAFNAGKRSFSLDEAAALLTESPELFSPGAALRPVCQDACMPVAATIAGPGERRYLGQLAKVYNEFGVSPSIIWPRASFTVIDRRTMRYAAKEGIEPVQLFASAGEIEAALARDTLPGPVEDALGRLDAAIAEGFRGVEDVVERVDRTLIGAVQKDRGRAMHIVSGLRDRIVRAHRSSLDLSRRRIETATHAVMPGGVPQERWFGVDSLLGVLDEIGMDSFIAMTSPGEDRHRIVLFD